MKTNEVECYEMNKEKRVFKTAREERERCRNKYLGKRALIADDNEVNLGILANYLQLFGFEVQQALDGREAVDLYLKEKSEYYSVIMMDVNMPELDGYCATEEIRKSKKEDGESIPIIAVSANTFASDTILSKQRGMSAHIAKPIAFCELSDILEHLIENREVWYQR